MYNPYDLIPMEINGVPTYGRPTEFDSEITDFEKMENAFGHPVKPKKLSTTCPGCGQGLEVEVKLADPPFSVITHTCQYCSPEVEAPADPFSNPLETGRMAFHELDPLLHNPNAQVVPQSKSVADRVDISKLASISELPEGPPENSQLVVDENLVQALELKKSKGKKRKTIKKVEPAEGLEEEQFFDDDLAEPE